MKRSEINQILKNAKNLYGRETIYSATVGLLEHRRLEKKQRKCF